MDTVKKTTKNIAKSNRTIANRFESDEQDLFLDKKGSTVMKDIAKTNNYIAKRLSIVTDDSDILNTSTPPTDENSFVTAGNIRDIYNVPYGIVGLNSSGLIDAAQLPSYVDDVIEGYYYNGAFYSDSSHQYEIVPETGKIYVDITDPDHSQSYRWSGSVYSIVADPREALFDVTFTEPVPGNLNSDKTLAEIEEAVSNGKVVRGFFGNITYYLTSIQHDTNVKFNATIKNINYNIEGKYLNSAWNWTYNSWDLSNIKPDWNATAGADNEILNKPSIPDTLDDLAVDATFTFNGVTQTVTCDKTFSELGDTPYIAIVLNYSGGVTYNHKCIASKSSDLANTITTPMLQSQGGTYELNFLYSNDSWSVTFISPSSFQAQSDWNQANTNAKDFIKNKPSIPDTFNDLEVEATFNISIDTTDPSNPVYSVTCDKIPSDLSNDPLVRVIVSQLGYDVKIVAHRNAHVVVANIMTNVNCDTLVFTYNSGWTVVHKKSPVAISGSYDDLTDNPIPTPTQSDSGKLLSVDANGDYELITIVNSENIAY